MDLRTTITKVLLGEEIVTEDSTVIGKMEVSHPKQSGKGMYSAADHGVSTEHEHEGKKYTVHTEIDGDGDHYHDIHDHSTGQKHMSVPHGRSIGMGQASPLHKKLIGDHLKVARKTLVGLRARNV
jgi:hypothetical protein